MNTEETKHTTTMPDQLPLNKSQAKRLSGLTGINAKESRRGTSCDLILKGMRSIWS